MASAEIGALRVTLGIDSGAFTDGMNAAQKQMQRVGKSMQNVGATLATVGAGMTAAITGPLIAAGFAASKAAAEAADAMGQVEAALSSMGDGAGRTKEQLAGLASGIMRNSLYDDDDILRQVTANLLTFGNVAGTSFDRAQQAAVDLATRMGGDLQSATLMVGKALNDPAKGLAALRRVGIQFTEQQQEQIKAMSAAGDMAGAQAVMLSELERQFGGSAAAAANTDPYDKLRDSLNDLSESAGAVINRFLVPMTTALAGLFDKFNGLSPQMQTFAVAGAAIAAALGPALIVVGAVVGALGTMATALAAGGVLAGLAGFAVAAAPFVAAAAAIAAAIYVFRDDLAPVLQAFGQSVMEAVGPSIIALVASARDAFAALGPAISALAAVVGPLLTGLAKIMVEVFGPDIISLVKLLAVGIGNAFAVIGASLKVLTALLKGDWAEAWNATGTLIMTVVRGLGNVIEAVFPGIGRTVGRMVDEVKNFMGRKLFEIFDGAIRKIREVSHAFFEMFDAVVGNSYVPDMVEGVAEWMAKLDAGMVLPAVRATDAAKAAFESLRNDVAGIMEGLLSDTERASRLLASETASINAAVAAGQMSRREGDIALGGIAARDMSRAELPKLGDITEAVGFQTYLKDGLDKAQSAFDDTARSFGDEFSYSMERVLSGDVKGAFMDMLSGSLRASLSSLGSSLFKSFGNAGGGMDFGKIASSISGVKLPGFATGGSFKVGGMSGIDKNLVAFRATKGEMVDIRRPGQGMDGGGHIAQIVPSPYFDVRVQRVTAPGMVQTGQAAAKAGSGMAQAELTKRSAYRTR